MPNEDMARARAENLYAQSAFADAFGRRRLATRLARRAGNRSNWLESHGFEGVTAPDWETMTPDERDAAMRLYASRGPKRAQEAKLFAAQEAEREDEKRREQALKSMDDFEQGMMNDPRRASIWTTIRGQLQNPDALDEAFKLAEGDVRAEANQQSRAFEQRMRENLGARGMPGNPYLSGSGLGAIGGFEGQLGAAEIEALRRNKIQQVLAREDYRNQAQRAAEAFLANEYGNRMNLTGLRTSVQTKTPLWLSGEPLQSYAEYQAAMRAGGGSPGFWETWGPGLGEMAGGAGMLGASGAFG